jgi:hypothetical protein
MICPWFLACGFWFVVEGCQGIRFFGPNTNLLDNLFPPNAASLSEKPEALALAI